MTTGVTNDTYQVVGTLTNNQSGAQGITNLGIFDVVTSPPQTTLNGSVTSGQTSITVTSASGFPGSGAYQIQVEGEVMNVTGGQGTTTWTVTRGYNGSTAASHSSLVTLTGGGTAGANGGNMLVKGDFGVVTLNQNDTLTATVKLQFT